MTITDNNKTPRGRTITPVPTLVALVLGLLVGLVAHQTQWPVLVAAQEFISPLGQLWLRALQMTVFPLVILNVLVALLTSSAVRNFGQIGAAALAMFVVLLIAGATLAFVGGTAVIGWLPVDPNAGDALAALSARESDVTVYPQAQPSLGTWLMSLIPTNPFTALAQGHLLPVLVFTVLLGVALTKIDAQNREIVTRFFHGLSEAMFVLVNWILVFTPIGVFALTAAMATGLGTGAISAIFFYIAICVSFLLLATALLYPLTTIFGRISLLRFARGVFPSQLVAFSTRSSLATLPSLIEGAQNRLHLRPDIANLTLPLSVSVFKANQTITTTLKLLLIAHLFSIDLTFGQTLSFIASIIILSFSAVGIPLGGNSMKALPVYLAAGIPLEAYILLRSVETIPDIFKTVLNVTADMSVAVIANRIFGGEVANAGTIDSSGNIVTARSIDKPVLFRDEL